MLKVRFVVLILTLHGVSNAQDLKCTSEKVYKPFFPSSPTQSGNMRNEREVDPNPDPQPNEVKDYYYICLGDTGEAVKKTCPPNLLFDVNLLGCAYLPAEPAVPEEPSEKCKTDTQLVPTAEKCNKCYQCVKAGVDVPKTTEVDCKDAENNIAGFNIFINDFVKGWDCTKNNADRPDCSKDSKIYGTKLIVDPKSCESFYRCQGTIRIKDYCPKGHLFDTVSRVCRHEKEAICPLATTSPGAGTGVKDICKGKAATFVADPNYCKGYYYCIDEKTLYWGFCANDKYFNNGFCVFTRPDTCKCEDAEFEDDEDTVYYPHPNKSMFYRCEKGKFGIEESCPPGYVFDFEDGSCTK